jgi:hypothetical protein
MDHWQSRHRYDSVDRSIGGWRVGPPDKLGSTVGVCVCDKKWLCMCECVFVCVRARVRECARWYVRKTLHQKPQLPTILHGAGYASVMCDAVSPERAVKAWKVFLEGEWQEQSEVSIVKLDTGNKESKETR